MEPKKSPFPKSAPTEGEFLLCDPEAERDLIAAVLEDGRFFEYANLRSEDFAVPRYRAIWAACESLQAAGKPIEYKSIWIVLFDAGWPFEQVRSWAVEIDHYQWSFEQAEAKKRAARRHNHASPG
jgi:hypothetical protein